MSSLSQARDERADLAAFLETLPLAQWDSPTLCEGWRVRDVVAHVISYDHLDVPGLLGRAVRARFRPHRMNDIGVTGYSDHDPGSLLASLRDRLEPRGLSTGLGGVVALADGLIHHQDIRRPFGARRDIPAERLLPALSAALFSPATAGLWRTRGLRLVATDLDWSTGRGPEVRGAAEALLMTIAGRRGVVDELSGPGQRQFADRIAT